jgi:hypothetical protein
VSLACILEKIEAAHPGHMEVGDYGIEALPCQTFQGFATTRATRAIKALAGEVLAQEVCNPRLVVDDQNSPTMNFVDFLADDTWGFCGLTTHHLKRTHISPC